MGVEMVVVEYMLHRNADRELVTPDFIDDPGYFPRVSDGTMIGIIFEPVRHYVPETLVVLTFAQIHARQLAVHGETPMRHPSGAAMTEAEVAAFVDAWAAVKGVAV